MLLNKHCTITFYCRALVILRFIDLAIDLKWHYHGMYKQLYVEKIPAFKDWKEVYLESTVLRIFLRRYILYMCIARPRVIKIKYYFCFFVDEEILIKSINNQLIIKHIYIQFCPVKLIFKVYNLCNIYYIHTITALLRFCKIFSFGYTSYEKYCSNIAFSVTSLLKVSNKYPFTIWKM